MHIEYKCHWPNCQYHTDERSLIEFHHIVPKELWPRLNKHVTLSYCPTHHRMIYHPESTKGHHSIKTDTKLIIKGIYPAAPGGYAVEYQNMKGMIFYEFYEGSYTNEINHEIAQKELDEFV